ncbi:2577_t:CDS:2, partial [Gigaspora rosea]
NTPTPSILPPQHHPTQDLDKEPISIVNAEIEETDMKHDLEDNYMWFGAGDADCSGEDRVNFSPIK